jgi:hypothetical protein
MDGCQWVVHLKPYRVEVVYTETEISEGTVGFTREFAWICAVEAVDEKDAEGEARSDFGRLAREPPAGIEREIVALTVTEVQG